MSKAVRRTAALQVTALFCRKFLVWPGSAEPEGTGSRPFLLHTQPRCQGKSRHSRTVPWGWIPEKQTIGPSSSPPFSFPTPLWYKETW